VEVSRENVWWKRGSTGRDFHEFIYSLIIPACDVVEFETVKLVLKAPFLFTVGFHLGVMATRALHDLIDHELGVTSNIEVLDPSSMAIRKPVMSASYSATLFDAGK
jgi:hypothetical protein